MFNDLVESSAATQGNRKPWTVTVSMVVQLFVLAILVLIPLIYTRALPKALLNMIITAPTPPPAAAPPALVHSGNTNSAGRRPRPGIFTAPPSIPPGVSMIREPAPPPELPGTGVIGATGGDNTAASNAAMIGILNIGTPPVAPPIPKPSQPRIYQRSNVQQAKLISQPLPEYPPLARQARIQGTVVLHAIIAEDGRVAELTVISGPALLIQAALDAVRRWRYQPTLLNNEPVEVDTTITVVFTMAGN
ncbi:MAG: energy transducer TonB [Candidatus Acidiferrales bacterium]|jgi:protein TonB